jgi:ribosomal-protein-alanine acetyltransferase
VSVELRRAGIDDLDAIMALEEATFVSDAWSREQMAADLSSQHTTYLVVLDADAVVGYGGVLAPRGAGEADIQTLAVAPSFRRAGVGRRLMTELIEAAERHGASRIFLEVRADNPAAQALYDSLGFVEVGVRPRYYQPDAVDAIVMRRESRPAAPTSGPVGAES